MKIWDSSLKALLGYNEKSYPRQLMGTITAIASRKEFSIESLNIIQQNKEGDFIGIREKTKEMLFSTLNFVVKLLSCRFLIEREFRVALKQQTVAAIKLIQERKKREAKDKIKKDRKKAKKLAKQLAKQNTVRRTSSPPPTLFGTLETVEEEAEKDEKAREIGALVPLNLDVVGQNDGGKRDSNDIDINNIRATTSAKKRRNASSKKSMMNLDEMDSKTDYKTDGEDEPNNDRRKNRRPGIIFNFFIFYLLCFNVLMSLCFNV